MREVEGWERKGWKVKGKWEREHKVMVVSRNLRIGILGLVEGRRKRKGKNIKFGGNERRIGVVNEIEEGVS